MGQEAEREEFSGEVGGGTRELGLITIPTPMAQGGPFLGTLLTDLVMLDTVMEDYLEVSLRAKDQALGP